MKTNANLFLALALCVVLGGLLFYMGRSNEETYGWNPSEMYGELGSNERGSSSFTNATFSGSSSNGGVALSMPTRPFSLRARTTTPSYTLSFSEGSGVGSSSPISYGQSPIAHMTSTSEYRSFGGGGNGGMATGGSIRSNSSNLSPIAYSPSPISYSPSPISNSAVSYNPSTALPARSGSAVSAQSPIIYGLSSMSTTHGIFDYALQTTYGIGAYEQDSYYNSMRIGGRKRSAETPGADDIWTEWLDGLINNGAYWTGSGTVTDEDGNTYTINYFDESSLRALYESLIESGDLASWMSWDYFREWFLTQSNKYAFNSPIGEGCVFLLLLALIYALCRNINYKKIERL